MKPLVFIPVLGVMFLLQISIFSRIPLLYGIPDLVLLSLAAWSLNERVRYGILWSLVCGIINGVVSAIPLFVPIVGYVLIGVIGRLLTKRLWQSPILAMLGTVFVGSMVVNILPFVVLLVSGTEMPIMDSINLIIMPSTLYNILLSFPVFFIIRDFSQWVYPVEFEI